MSKDEQPRRFNINLFPSFFVALFILLALTGNCRTCGFDRDYVGEAIDARKGAE